MTALTGCGYTTGLTLGPDYHSVGLEIFGNDTPEPDLELSLHRALTQATRNMLDAQLVDPDRSQLVVRGRLTRFQRRAGLRSADNVWMEGGVWITAEAELLDRRRDVVLVGPVRAEANVGYTRTNREAEPNARQRALNNLAERLVLDLFTGTVPGEPGSAPGAPTVE
ncbi:MAG: LPS assembly lipoprotein LptE [bacterium]